MLQKIKRIMIDPGHGGKDYGKVCGGIMEKNINLDIGNKLFEILDLTYPFFPFRTRGTDIFIDLRHRIHSANELPVDFFISLHCNAYKTDKPYGIQVYYYHEYTAEVASIFLNELLKIYPLKSKWNKTSQAGFYVLKHANMPALLLELGFLSNPDDRQWITSFLVQLKVVDAIIEAFVKWNIKELEKKNGI